MPRASRACAPRTVAGRQRLVSTYVGAEPVLDPRRCRRCLCARLQRCSCRRRVRAATERGMCRSHGWMHRVTALSRQSQAELLKVGRVRARHTIGQPSLGVPHLRPGRTRLSNLCSPVVERAGFERICQRRLLYNNVSSICTADHSARSDRPVLHTSTAQGTLRRSPGMVESTSNSNAPKISTSTWRTFQKAVPFHFLFEFVPQRHFLVFISQSPRGGRTHCSCILHPTHSCRADPKKTVPSRFDPSNRSTTSTASPRRHRSALAHHRSRPS